MGWGMILYSKSGDFLGIGKDELSFLGYEDLDEFRYFHSDVADLFVNRPGYICKFKNFSWIDYALHSGTPKKSAIIRLKTGNEVEIPLRIKELFLYSPKRDEDSLYYSVEFENKKSQNSGLQNGSSFTKSTFAPQAQTSQIFENTTSDVEVFKKEEKATEISFEEDYTKNEAVDFDNKKQNTTEEPTLKLKIDIDTQESKKEEIVPLLKNFNEAGLSNKEIVIDFDLANCVGELGLDISLVGEFITNYLDEIDKTTPIIKASLEKGDEVALKSCIYKLKGISDALHMHQLSNALTNIFTAADVELKKSELEKFEKIVLKFKEDLK